MIGFIQSLDSQTFSLRYYYTTLALKKRLKAYPRATMFNNYEARGFSAFARSSTPYKPHIRLVSYSGIIYRLTA